MMESFLRKLGIDIDLSECILRCGSREWIGDSLNLFVCEDGDSLWKKNRQKDLIEVSLLKAMDEAGELVNKYFLIPKDGFELKRYDNKRLDFLSFGMKVFSLESIY